MSNWYKHETETRLRIQNHALKACPDLSNALCGELERIPSVQSIKVNESLGSITIIFTPCGKNDIKLAIEEQKSKIHFIGGSRKAAPTSSTPKEKLKDAVIEAFVDQLIQSIARRLVGSLFAKCL